MDVTDAIRNRRSIKEFDDRPIGRDEIESLLEAAVWAPNHRMTEPWRFVVLGRESMRRYAEIRARLKAANVGDADAAEAVRAKVGGRTLAIPAVIAVTCDQAEDPVVREEDLAATWMAIQNMQLAATARGLGMYIHTGGILEDEELRGLVGVDDGRRIIALVDVGEPASVPSPKPRTPARDRTRWLP